MNEFYYLSILRWFFIPGFSHWIDHLLKSIWYLFIIGHDRFYCNFDQIVEIIELIFNVMSYVKLFDECVI